MDERLEPATEALILEIREEIRLEGERFRQHLKVLIERQGRKMPGLIDAIELMKYIDSEGR
jgi:hypothetical protein